MLKLNQDHQQDHEANAAIFSSQSVASLYRTYLSKLKTLTSLQSTIIHQKYLRKVIGYTPHAWLSCSTSPEDFSNIFMPNKELHKRMDSSENDKKQLKNIENNRINRALPLPLKEFIENPTKHLMKLPAFHIYQELNALIQSLRSKRKFICNKLMSLFPFRTFSDENKNVYSLGPISDFQCNDDLDKKSFHEAETALQYVCLIIIKLSSYLDVELAYPVIFGNMFSGTSFPELCDKSSIFEGPKDLFTAGCNEDAYEVLFDGMSYVSTYTSKTNIYTPQTPTLTINNKLIDKNVITLNEASSNLSSILQINKHKDNNTTNSDSSILHCSHSRDEHGSSRSSTVSEYTSFEQGDNFSVSTVNTSKSPKQLLDLAPKWLTKSLLEYAPTLITSPFKTFTQYSNNLTQYNTKKEQHVSQSALKENSQFNSPSALSPLSSPSSSYIPFPTTQKYACSPTPSVCTTKILSKSKTNNQKHTKKSNTCISEHFIQISLIHRGIGNVWRFSQLIDGKKSNFKELLKCIEQNTSLLLYRQDCNYQLPKSNSTKVRILKSLYSLITHPQLGCFISTQRPDRLWETSEDDDEDWVMIDLESTQSDNIKINDYLIGDDTTIDSKVYTCTKAVGKNLLNSASLFDNIRSLALRSYNYYSTS